MIDTRPQYTAHLPGVLQWAHHAKKQLHWALLSKLDPLGNPTPTRPWSSPRRSLRRRELVGGDVDPNGSMASPYKYDADALSEASIAPPSPWPWSGMPPRCHRSPAHSNL
ncbi:hypothetical protein PAHAL_9G056500 [Panicum hallii]|uniref:Uncharacterized protein n=1 Tax=Panicum hallii TaxID=206008 RepID=A0A2T8I091_9POAL|nr:hypothetical protein PAHAL_9G056500 [Panicum hallii]